MLLIRSIDYIFLISAARKAFESKRKAHYNEFFAAKMARKLLEEEEDEDDDEADANKQNEDFEEDKTERSCEGGERASSSTMAISSDTS